MAKRRQKTKHYCCGKSTSSDHCPTCTRVLRSGSMFGDLLDSVLESRRRHEQEMERTGGLLKMGDRRPYGIEDKHAKVVALFEKWDLRHDALVSAINDETELIEVKEKLKAAKHIIRAQEKQIEDGKITAET